MSLINKMLKDLEARQTGAAPRTDARPIFHDLQPTGGERRTRSLAAGGLLVVVMAAAAFFAWQHYARAPRTLPVVVAAPVATPPVIETAPPAADSVAAPAPSTAPTLPPVTAAPVKPEVVKPAPAKTQAASRPATKPKAATARAKAEPEAEGRIEKIERVPNSAELAENLYREAARVHAQGNPAEAERLFKTLLVTNPRHTLARERLAAIQLDGGRWQEAQGTLEQGVAQVPQHLPFRYQLARLYLERGEPAQAQTLLEDARHAGHTDAELHAFLAAIHQRAGRHGDAVKSYREALTLRPEEGRWWVGTGISLEAQQESSAARDAYRRALDTGRLPANLARYAEDRIKALVVTR